MNLETEIQIVKSVYCRDGEFLGDVESSCAARSLSLCLSDRGSFSLSISNDYPERAPFVSVSQPVLTREEANKLNKDLRSFYYRNFDDSGMLLNTISWLMENIPLQENVLESNSDTVRESYVCVVGIDHMRSKDNYLKCLKKWSEQLETNTFVLFYGRKILLTVRGTDSTIEEFLKRLKNRKIDIDSTGKPCKERMISIICNQPYESSYRAEFRVVETKEKDELATMFQSMDGMDSVFKKFIKPLLQNR